MKAKMKLALRVATLTLIQSLAGCADDCEVKQCADLGEGRVSTNGKSYTKCYLETNPFHTTLEDEAGEVFFDCTDSATSSCLRPIVEAQFSYCDAH